MTSVEVVLPFRRTDSHREAAFEHVFGLYRALRPGWAIRVSEDLSDRPWSKGAIVWKAVFASDARVVIVADADVWCQGVIEAVQRVQDGAAWASPHVHGHVHRLTEASTARVYAGEGWDQELEEKHRPMPGGGLVVVPRDAYLRCPIDPRFHGWGQEDEAWYRALTQVVGSPWFGDAGIHHLWHPHPPRMDRRRGNAESWQLMRKYRRATYDRAAMAALVEEGLHDLQPHQPSLRHPAAV